MKKLFLSLSLATLLFGADSGVKFEFTPTYNYNVFYGDTTLKDRSAPGFRFGYHLDDSFLDQVEFGFEKYSKLKYEAYPEKRSSLNRTFINGIKGIDLYKSFYLYGLAGFGYEDFTNGIDEKQGKSGILGHLGVGLKYKLSDQLALRLETRHAWLGSNTSNRDWVSTLGLSFGFGGKKEAQVLVEEQPKIEVKKALCPTPREGALLDENGCEVTISLEGHFGFDQVSINQTFEDKIEAISKILEQNQHYTLILEGHTDNTGSRAYNQKLSELRAQNVANELVKFGVAKNRIQVKGYGPDKPRSSNDTKEGRADNRRVEAKFFLQ